VQTFTQIIINAREVAKYSYAKPVEGYISETVQDTASDTRYE